MLQIERLNKHWLRIHSVKSCYCWGFKSSFPGNHIINACDSFHLILQSQSDNILERKWVIKPIMPGFANALANARVVFHKAGVTSSTANSSK